jgi:hypothetical protein
MSAGTLFAIGGSGSLNMPRRTNPTTDGAQGNDGGRWDNARTEDGVMPDGSRAEGSSPNPDDIARRAYERFQMRGGDHGHDQQDWLDAERELHGSPSANDPTTPE